MDITLNSFSFTNFFDSVAIVRIGIYFLMKLMLLRYVLLASYYYQKSFYDSAFISYIGHSYGANPKNAWEHQKYLIFYFHQIIR